MFKSLQKKVAIDLGSSQIRVLAVDEQLLEDGNLVPHALHSNLLVDDACVAKQKKTGRLIAVGAAALEMQGRLSKDIEVIFPFAASRILDQEAAVFLLQQVLQKTMRGLFINAVAMVTTVAEVSEFSQQTLSQLFYDLGFAEVYLVSQPLAAAIGAGVPTAMSKGVLFYQLGASRKEATIIALGSVMAQQSSDFAGQSLSKKIDQLLQQDYQLQISQQSLEKLQQQVAAIGKDHNKNLAILGKSLNDQLPRELRISSEMLRPVTLTFAHDCREQVSRLLREVEPALLDDILDKGLLLSGALAQLPGLEAYLTKQLGLPVAVVEEPALAALEGAALMLLSLAEFKGSLAFVG